MSGNKKERGAGLREQVRVVCVLAWCVSHSQCARLHVCVCVRVCLHVSHSLSVHVCVCPSVYTRREESSTHAQAHAQTMAASYSTHAHAACHSLNACACV